MYIQNPEGQVSLAPRCGPHGGGLPRWDVHVGPDRKVAADVRKESIFLRLEQLVLADPDRCETGLKSKERHSSTHSVLLINLLCIVNENIFQLRLHTLSF